MKTLTLGTANFGNSYGVANKDIMISPRKAKEIVSWAQTNGVNNFDTAIAYGDAELILGSCLDLTCTPSIDTKLNSVSCSTREQIVKSVNNSRNKLRVEQLGTVYLHDDRLLHSVNQRAILNGLKDILDLGIARQIGVSVYTGNVINSCKKILPELQVFQVPENICDRRLFDSKELIDLAADGNVFVVRSVFLQGLLLMEPESIPLKLSPVKKAVYDLHQFCSERSISVLDLCLSYIESIPWSDRYVVGVASVDQLKAITAASLSLPAGFEKFIKNLPDEIVDPRKWQL